MLNKANMANIIEYQMQGKFKDTGKLTFSVDDNIYIYLPFSFYHKDMRE